jgi:hypothetical protein
MVQIRCRRLRYSLISMDRSCSMERTTTGSTTKTNAQQMVLDPTTPQEALLPTYANVPVNDLAWNNPYFYKCPGDTGDYDLICYGADGQPGVPTRTRTFQRIRRLHSSLHGSNTRQPVPWTLELQSTSPMWCPLNLIHKSPEDSDRLRRRADAESKRRRGRRFQLRESKKSYIRSVRKQPNCSTACGVQVSQEPCIHAM